MMYFDPEGWGRDFQEMAPLVRLKNKVGSGREMRKKSHTRALRSPAVVYLNKIS